jgi:hypothetical protein
MRLSRKLVLALVGIVVLGSTAAVWAYFAANGGGAASAHVGTLGTPTHVTTSYTSGSSTVGVSWTGVASPGSGTFGYYVTRYAGTTPSAACGTSPAALTTSATCNDAGVANGTFTYKVTAVYHSWTAQSAGSAPVTVASDTTPPTFGSPALTFATTGANTYASGGSVYYNPQGANSGSFTVNAPNVADPDSGLQKVNFPALAGMTGGGDVSAPGPYSTTYGWTSGSTSSGSNNVTASNNATLSATALFNVFPDTTAPAGGAITANGAATFSTTGTVSLGKTDFTDLGSGIAGNVITRAAGTLSGNVCGSLSGAATVTISGGNDPATLGTGCYQYTLTGTDNVGNTATTTSSVVKVDRAAPSGGAITANGAATFNTTGTVSLSTTLFTDANSGIAANAITRAAGTLTGNSCGSLSGATAVTVSGGNDAATLTSGCFQYTLTGTDNAGNTATATSSVVKVDRVAPTGGAITANGAATFNTSGTVSLSTTPFTDANSGIAANVITRATGTLTGNSCGSLSGATAVTVSGGNDAASLATGCYQYTLTGTDNAGNTATTSSSAVKVDTTGPALTITASGANVSTTGGTTVYFKNGGGSSGTFTVTAADPDSGINASSFPNAPSGWTKSTGTNSATYTLGNASSSTSLSGFSATSGAGTVSNLTVTITLDATAPTVTAVVGAARSDGTAVPGTNSVRASGKYYVYANISDASSGVNPATTTATVTALAGSTSTVSLATAGGPWTVAGTSYSYRSAIQTAGSGVSGSQTITATANDNVGNTPSATSVAVTVDNTAPTVSSINRSDPNPTKASSLIWTVTFSEPVAGVTAGNFSVVTSNIGGTAPTITSVTPSGSVPASTWTVTVNTSSNTGTDSGSVGLNLANNTGITDAATNALSTATFAGQAYTFDTTAPAVAITSLADGGGNSKLAVNGTGSTGANDGTVTVYVCRSATCSAATAVETITGVTVQAGGTWSVLSSSNGTGLWYATAVRTDLAGNTAEYDNFGPFNLTK